MHWWPCRPILRCPGHTVLHSGCSLRRSPSIIMISMCNVNKSNIYFKESSQWWGCITACRFLSPNFSTVWPLIVAFYGWFSILFLEHMIYISRCVYIRRLVTHPCMVYLQLLYVLKQTRWIDIYFSCCNCPNSQSFFSIVNSCRTLEGYFCPVLCVRARFSLCT